MKDRKFARIAFMTALVVAMPVAQAEPFPAAHYEDELRRCIDRLRPDLDLREGDRVLHFLDRAERQGPWYRFELETTVTDGAGEIVLDGLQVSCRANRWDQRTEIRIETTAAPVRAARR